MATLRPAQPSQASCTAPHCRAAARQVLYPLVRMLPPLDVTVARVTRHSASFVAYAMPEARHVNLTLRVGAWGRV
jgi:hypothetical protein